MNDLSTGPNIVRSFANDPRKENARAPFAKSRRSLQLAGTNTTMSHDAPFPS